VHRELQLQIPRDLTPLDMNATWTEQGNSARSAGRLAADAAVSIDVDDLPLANANAG